MAREYLQELQATTPIRPSTDPLLDFVPRVSPHFAAPAHLKPYVELLERAPRERIRAVVAAPPRHGKTETTIHALSSWLREFPSGRFGYATYAQALTDSIAFNAKSIADRAGVFVEGVQREWRTSVGGRVVWTSVGGSFTGKGVDKVLVIDDPVKDRASAESALKRSRTWDWFVDVARTRVEPGASIIVMATRWHPDDLSGRLIKDGWQYVNLKAVADSADDPLGRAIGEPLWAQERPLSWLAEHQRNAFTWASLFQGEPRPRSGTVFREPAYYSKLPTQYTVGYGVDLAYTAKTSADHSVVVEGWLTKERGADGKDVTKLYIVDARRAQVDAPEFTLTLSSKWAKARGPMRWYCATSEMGAAQFVKKKIPSFDIKIASADKYVRALPAAEAWNAGRILLPSPRQDAFGVELQQDRWVSEFLDEVLAFTGVNDPDDDQVDALAALWDVMHTPEWNASTFNFKGL